MKTKEEKYLYIVDHSDKYIIIQISPIRKRLGIGAVGMLRRGSQGFDHATS
jgi:hypothetical protein